MVEGTRENFATIGQEENVFEKTKLTADSGFHTEKNMQMLIEKGIDAYVADTRFRQRNTIFAEASRYKESFKKEVATYLGTISIYQPKDFTFSKDKDYCIYPAGKRLYRNGGNVLINGKRAIKFRGSKMNCMPCGQRAKYMRDSNQTETRQVAYFIGKTEHETETFTQKMRRKIDSVAGRLIYN